MTDALMNLWLWLVATLGPAGAVIALALAMALVALLLVVPASLYALSGLREQDQQAVPPPVRLKPGRLERLRNARILSEINADLDRREAEAKGGRR